MNPGTLFIDSSTIDPATARELSALTKAKGSEMIDAPVSGGTIAIRNSNSCLGDCSLGVGGAQAGTLTFMVGAPADAFERARPLLSCMGKNLVHCGDVGTCKKERECVCGV